MSGSETTSAEEQHLKEWDRLQVLYHDTLVQNEESIKNDGLRPFQASDEHYDLALATDRNAPKVVFFSVWGGDDLPSTCQYPTGAEHNGAQTVRFRCPIDQLIGATDRLFSVSSTAPRRSSRTKQLLFLVVRPDDQTTLDWCGRKGFAELCQAEKPVNQCKFRVDGDKRSLWKSNQSGLYLNFAIATTSNIVVDDTKGWKTDTGLCRSQQGVQHDESTLKSKLLMLQIPKRWMLTKDGFLYLYAKNPNTNEQDNYRQQTTKLRKYFTDKLGGRWVQVRANKKPVTTIP
eukprot:TRINITY_DN66181_c5_g4_i1.p1 TRINITY_DN66181_c5_g4~~TRINITY_DN66181_c5_g4_i1.p1  ORF type:complete len:288 (-),score=59.67 TRINITY_DN66181_c5_g4_i1:323-1186(-)